MLTTLAAIISLAYLLISQMFLIDHHIGMAYIYHFPVIEQGGHFSKPEAPPAVRNYIITTDRSTSPRSILWNASSTSSSAMVSDTNLSRSNLP